MEIKQAPLFLQTATSSTDLRFEKVYRSCFTTLPHLDFVESFDPFWDATALGLDRVTHFQKLSVEEKSEILSQCGEDLLRESCFIEMAGMSYTARMSLESQRLEERLFYSVMSSEEATHFYLLRPFVKAATLAQGPDPFTSLIGEMIEEADRERVIFLIQVLLEGWGLTHYSWMASHCQNENLRSVFKTVLKDEARHHAAGLALAKEGIGRGDKKVMRWLEQILSMVRIGPIRLLASLENVAGTLSANERQTILLELDAEAATRERLLRLRGILSQHVEPPVLTKLEEKHLFDPSF